MTADFVSGEGAALVVGGSGGIGAVVARLLASRGSDVAVTYRRNAESGQAVAKTAATQVSM